MKTLLENVGEVVKEGCGYSWDGVCLAVAMPQSTTPYLEKSFDEWEDFCQEFGFEFIDFESEGRNEYAGVSLPVSFNFISSHFLEPMGIERLKEALEANDWDGGDDLGDDINPEDFEDDDEEAEGSIGFGIEAAEMEAEMFGMKQAIYGGRIGEDEDVDDTEGDKEVEQLQEMMLKMQAVRGKYCPFSRWDFRLTE